ncbi:MAG: DUF177 domain-containing protein [Nitrospirota bacterium]
MQIPLSGIPPKGLELHLEMEPAVLGLEDSGVQFVAPIRVQSRLVVMDRTVYVSGDADAQVRLQCVRCLEAIPFPVRSSFQVNVEPQDSASGKTPGEWHELHRGELDAYGYSGDAIDLSALVREQILLVLPAYPLCRADCRGLCPQCGADRNRLSCRCVAAEAPPPMTQFQERLKKIIQK